MTPSLISIGSFGLGFFGSNLALNGVIEVTNFQMLVFCIAMLVWGLIRAWIGLDDDKEKS